MRASSPLLSRPALLRAVALALLVGGLAVAFHIDQSASRAAAAEASRPSDELAIAPLPVDDSKRYGYQVGQLSGGIGVLMDRFGRSVSVLGQGRPLAIVVVVASFAAAGALLLRADRVRG